MKNRKKQLKKLTKGFTLIELISVISIMAVILLIAIPTYSTISNRSKENIYQAKVTELLAKAEGYSESSSVFVMDVNTLIKEGIMSPDNENGNLIDPRSNRKMNCDIIEVNYEDNVYKAHYVENNECLSEEEMNNRYGKGFLIAFDENNNEIANNTWTKTSFEKIQFKFKKEEDLENLESLTWSGDGDKTCSKEKYDNCLYTIEAEKIKNVTIRLNVNLIINNQRSTQTYEFNSLIDNEVPLISNINVNNDNDTNDLRKVDFELDDMSGSGIKEFSYASSPTCDESLPEYIDHKKETSDKNQTLFLDNGDYYLCAKDNAGNMTEAKEEYKIHVEKVTTSRFTIRVTNSSGNAWTGNDVTLGVNWPIDNLDFCATKIDNGSYERYNGVYDQKSFTYHPTFSGNQKKSVHFICYDKAGNKSNEVTTNVLIDKDKPSLSYSVTSQTIASNGYYKAITLRANVSDALSGISSIKYCEGENDCNPTTNVTGNFTVNLASGKNRKVCTIVTDKAGNSTGKVCSNAYNVDGVNPTISLSETSTAGENGWVKTASITGTLEDTISGLSGAKYCKSTSNCTPNTKVSISNNKINVGITNASNQKVCLNVTDNAGNTSSTVCSKNYYADNTAPTVSITASTSNANATVSATNVKDNLSGVVSFQYRVDSGNWISSTSNKYTFTNLTDGNHTFYVRVKDKAGNYSSAPSKILTISNGPKLTRIGDFISKNQNSSDGMRNNYNLVPLNESQIVIVDGDEVYYSNGKPKNTYELEAQVLNVTPTSSSYGPVVKLMNEQAPLSEYNVRVDDSTIVVGGDANTRGGSVRVATLKINGNSITMPYISPVFGSAGYEREGIVGISHSLNNGTVGVYYNDSTSSKNNYAFRSYNYATGVRGGEEKLSRNVNDQYYYFHDIRGSSGAVSTSEGRYARQDIFDYTGLFNGTGLVRCNDNSIYQASRCYNKKAEDKIIDRSDYSKYLILLDYQRNAKNNMQQAYFSMTALGNDKLVLIIKNKTYNKTTKATTLEGHLFFYKKENGRWKLKKEMAAPENGATYSGAKSLSNEVLLPLKENAVLYNSYAGLYYISFT